MKTFREKLNNLNACSEAQDWVGNMTAEQAWASCERGDWMLWLLGRFDPQPDSPAHRQLVGVAAECAELALPVHKKYRPDDSRVRDCIEACKRYAAGELTFVELTPFRRAAYAADAAAADAAYAAAADAAYAAATDAYAAYAAYAADAAAYAAAARSSTLKACADIVRKHCPQPPKF